MTLSSDHRPEQVLQHDLEASFVEAISIAVPWEYDTLFSTLREQSDIPAECLEEEFNKRRGDCVRNALAKVCTRHGVPFEMKRLISNGQHKIIIRAGRVVLVQEAVDAFNDNPKVSDYKVALAKAHGFVRQLEFDFGDKPAISTPWSGYVLAVLLHGPKGEAFTRSDKSLGTLTLGVPDAGYKHWTTRLDLYDLAMFGGEDYVPETSSDEEDATQEDAVTVTLKNKNSGRGVVEL